MKARNTFCIVIALTLLSASLALLAPARAFAAEPAGKIVFAIGKASILGVDGKSRPASRGESIFSGETIITEDNGRMQVRYSDGSFVSLIPKTEYKIDEYKFSGSADGSERGFFRLLKGGMRTVTGSIGKVRKENYKVATPVATIGIRGTWFSAFLDTFGRLLVSVGFDPDDPSGLTIANAVGLLELSRGENAVVENADVPPVKTERQVILDPPPPPTTVFRPAEQRNPDGTQTIVGASNTLINLVAAITGNATVAPVGVETSPFKGVAVVIGSPPVGFFGREVVGTPEDVFATIDLDKTLAGADPVLRGEIQPFIDAAPQSTIDFFKAKPAQVANFRDFNPTLAWGRWTNGRILAIDNNSGTFTAEVDDLTGNQSAHFILGTEPGPLPASAFATYTFLGGTPSTSESGATIGSGIVGGSLNVSFGPMPTVDPAFIVVHNAKNYFVNGTVNMVGELFSNQFGGGVSASTFGGGGLCDTSCLAEVDGFLAGPPTGPNLVPSNAGMSYIIREADPIHGVGGFVFDPSGE